MRLSNEELKVIRKILNHYLEDEEVREMGTFIQHGDVTTLEHCGNVVRTSWWLAHHLPGMDGIDEEALMVGALLHDFYGYDWHGRSLREAGHGFTHPEKARAHAVLRFGVNPKVEHIIRSHMWPLTLLHMPLTREAWVVTAADKYCSSCETLFFRKHSRPIGR